MNAGRATVRQLTQPAVQDVVIDAVVSGHGGDRHAGDAAGCHQLGLEFWAVGATAAASLGVLVVGVHVSTIFYVDTMLLDWRRHCQMGWPDAYQFMTPEQRHAGQDKEILQKLKQVYEAAKCTKPGRWKSRQTRNWEHIKEVWLNPPREHLKLPEKVTMTV